MERFFDGTDQENSKTQRGKGQIRKIKKKQEGKNGWKKKKRFSCMWRFPYWCVLHRSGTPSGYCPRTTLPQENPLVLEPPLQPSVLTAFLLLSIYRQKEKLKIKSVKIKYILRFSITIIRPKIWRKVTKCSVHGSSRVAKIQKVF